MAGSLKDSNPIADRSYVREKPQQSGFMNQKPTLPKLYPTTNPTLAVAMTNNYVGLPNHITKARAVGVESDFEDHVTLIPITLGATLSFKTKGLKNTKVAKQTQLYNNSMRPFKNSSRVGSLSNKLASSDYVTRLPTVVKNEMRRYFNTTTPGKWSRLLGNIF